MRSSCFAILVFVTAAHDVSATDDQERHGDCHGRGGDKLCQHEMEHSYCKYWLSKPVCHGTDSPCGCGSCPRGDSMCQESSGHDSYCKFWLSKPVCQGSNKPCGCKSGHLRLLAHKEEEKPEQKQKDWRDEDKEDEEDWNKERHDDDDKKQHDDDDKKKHDDDRRPHDKRTCHIGDHFCKVRTGNWASYCKFDNKPSTCQGDDSIKCSCKPQPHDCQEADAWCANMRTGSYCTYWQANPICHGTKKSCHCKPKWW